MSGRRPLGRLLAQITVGVLLLAAGPAAGSAAGSATGVGVAPVTFDATVALGQLTAQTGRVLPAYADRRAAAVAAARRPANLGSAAPANAATPTHARLPQGQVDAAVRDRAWAIGSSYTDVCADTDGVLDLRRAFTEQDTHALAAFAFETCAPTTAAAFGDSIVVFELYVPNGRGEGPDLLVGLYDETPGAGEWTVEVVLTPSDDVASWVTTYVGAGAHPDPYTFVGIVPSDALFGAFDWAFDVAAIDAQDRRDDLPELDRPLLTFPSPCTTYRTGRRVVRTAPERTSAVRQAAIAEGFTVVNDQSALGLLVLARPGWSDDDARLRAIPGIHEVRPPVLYEHAGTLTPTDPQYAGQWALERIHAPEGWDVRTGSGLRIAVIDDGVDGQRADLAGRVLAGVDTVFSAVLPAGANSDLGGHGTAVTGLAAAAGNDGVGMVGVDWTAQILPYRVFDAAGCADDVAITSAIRRAADAGAAVINLSLGGPADTASLREAVTYALGKGVVVVAAAGNDADLGNPVFYPAAIEGVIAVAATTRAGRAAFFSTSGTYVDLSAPGGSLDGVAANDVLSLGERGGFARLAGTSFSAPIVAGAAALYRAGAPTATPAQVELALERSATDLGLLGTDPFTGAGELHLGELLRDHVDHLDVAAALVASSVGGAADVTVTDADGDGLADLVLARGTDTAVAKGIGDGTFAVAATVAPVAATEVRAADLDGDGVDEVIALTATTIEVLAHDGLGGLEVVTTMPVGSQAQGLDVVDVDGDGRRDLVLVAVGDDALEIRFAVTPTTFTLRVLPLATAVTAPARAHVLARVTGAPSITVRTDNSLIHVRQTAPRAFAVGAPRIVTSTSASRGDVDGDADTDLVTTDSVGLLRVFPLLDDGSLGAAVVSGSADGNVPRRAIATPDLDGDGRAEVILRGGGAGAVRLLRTSGSGAYADAATWTLSAAGGIDRFVFGPVLDRGVPDVVAVSLADGRTGVLDVTDSAPPRVVASPWGGRFASAVDVVLRVVDADPSTRTTYTLTGTAPTPSSPQYTGPFTLTRSANLRWLAVDTAGNTRSGSVGIVVAPPALTTGGPTISEELATNAFTSTVADENTAVTWRFGDGEVAVQRAPQHIYRTAGGYRVVVTAVDLFGGWTAVERQVGVTDGGRAERVAGPARIETAVAVSRRFWSTASDVLVATGEDFPDALAAGALANGLDAPLLLTARDALPSAVRDEVVRLGASDVWILGGTGVVSEQVEAELAQLATVHRVAGTSRYATAAAIAELVGPSPYGEVALARGDAFADALSAGSLAASRDRIPTLLTRRDVLPGETLEALARMGVTRVFLIGGPNAIAPDIATALENAGYEVVRLSGANRFATSAAVVEESLHRFAFRDMPLTYATGGKFADALAATAASARLGGPLVLVPSQDLNAAPEIRDLLGAWADLLDDGYVIGGPGVVAEAVRTHLAAATKVR